MQFSSKYATMSSTWTRTHRYSPNQPHPDGIQTPLWARIDDGSEPSLPPMFWLICHQVRMYFHRRSWNQSNGNGRCLAPLDGIWGTRLTPLPRRYLCEPLGSWVIQSPTRTLLTSASVSSIAQDSSPRETNHGSCKVMMTTTRLTSPRSNHSGRMQSKLQRLPLSRQVSTTTAWRRPATMHRHPSRMWFPILARHTPPPKNHSNPTWPKSWQSKGNSKCSAKAKSLAVTVTIIIL